MRGRETGATNEPHSSRKPQGEPGLDKDGAIPPEGQVLPQDFAVEVTRRERREREADADRQAKGRVDPDDTPTKPVRRRLWQFWRRW